MSRWQTFRCACAFAKSVDDKNPYHFPRVGMADNVLYRGHWIIRHILTGADAVIWRSGDGTLHVEADTCCHGWFDETLPKPERITS